jgi:hypothetical protein
MIDNAHERTFLMELASAPLCLKRFDVPALARAAMRRARTMQAKGE